MSSSKITEIVTLDARANNPVMVHGHVPQPANECRGLRAMDMAKNGTGMVFVGCKNNLYRGYVQSAAQQAEQQQRTFVALRNRTTGKTRMVEVESCQLSNVCHDERMQSNQSFDRESIKRLLEKFDTKARNRVQRRIQREQVDFSVIGNRLQETMDELAVTNNEKLLVSPPSVLQGNQQLVQNEIRSKANPHARSLRDLYRAEDLIGASVLLRIDEAARTVLQIPPEQLTMANMYLENKVKAIMQSSEPSSETNLRTVKICLFMDVLARLLANRNQPRAMERRRVLVSPLAPLLVEPIRQQFLQFRCEAGQSQGREQVTKYTQDKALLYYLALAFVVEGTDIVPVSVVHRSLQVSKEEVITFARAIGAVYNARQDVFSKALNVLEKDEEDTSMLLGISDGNIGGKRRRGKRTYGKR
ncbi:uncharacterized protein LOC131210157 [Anopheles bellator]|uniref:uncharacterized protein LOC131210157 n=1 Tax=Anopheles bellator TaxID=139047 RepID=UPI00264A11B8|nr:uncharacterized protein LOC131210157 [Anopheles bellator]